MQIIINVVDIRIISWTVNVQAQNVTVDFLMLKDDGQPYQRHTATFWVTMPTSEAEQYWYQLPPEYVGVLTDLTVDARAALMGLVA